MRDSENHHGGNKVRSVPKNRKPNEVEKAQISPAGKAKLSAEDRVGPSIESSESKKIQAVLIATPDVRTERVEFFKKSIVSEQYVVKSEPLADKIIRESLWELNR